jgi:hypothetical protein
MQKNTDFKLFLDFFPTIDLPILLGEDEHHVFSAENETLPLPLIRKYILNINEKSDADLGENQDDTVEILEDDTNDLVEYIACFQISNTENHHAMVYWKADLLEYEYVLVTFDKNGNRIDAKPIGGMRAEGQTVHQSVTQIDEDGFIIIAEGTAHYEGVATTDFDAEEGKVRRLELRNDGFILKL